MFQTFEAPAAPTATAPRVAALRTILARRKLDAFLIPRADEFQNEYVPACAERLAFLTGFTGSAGLAVVASTSAALFVDGRYTVQAPREVDTTIFTICGIRSNDLEPWLIATLREGARIGFDPMLHTLSDVETLRATADKAKAKLVEVARNPVDQVWGKDRPPLPSGPLLIHPIEMSGQSPADKIAAVQKDLRQAGQAAAVICATDSVCWLFDIRGSDVAHNPVVLARAIVPASGKPELFVDKSKWTPEARAHLSGLVKAKPPEALWEQLAALKAAGKPVRLAANTASWAIAKALGGASGRTKSGSRVVVRGTDPCAELKTVKNAAEIAGARAAHLRDGVAITRFLAWLDRAQTDGSVRDGRIDEIGAVRQLEAFRQETGSLKEISFPTIAGSGPNGAIVHYRVSEATNRALQLGELFLIDSGGQYADGTTDITRTVAIGTPTREMTERFTLVLAGMIAVATARFPRGTRGVDLDPLARDALWRRGLIYEHGTGHGVGSYLNVHEGPASISKAGFAVLKPGMILSDEPGYYKPGAYGIRIENLILVGEPENVGGDTPMMGFETLTLAPIDRRLIVPSLLSPDQLAWLNAYHARVRKALSPHLDRATKSWLSEATQPVDVDGWPPETRRS